jgi:arginine repressor
MTDNGGYASLSQGPFLFNLELDPNESYSLIESMPGKAQELARMLDEFETSIEANTRGWY